jgi:hypothetical protein
VTFQIILLALVAAFLGLRLYSVLGKRTGHEQEPLIRKPLEETPAGSIRPAVPTLLRASKISPKADCALSLTLIVNLMSACS